MHQKHTAARRPNTDRAAAKTSTTDTRSSRQRWPGATALRASQPAVPVAVHERPRTLRWRHQLTGSRLWWRRFRLVAPVAVVVKLFTICNCSIGQWAVHQGAVGVVTTTSLSASQIRTCCGVLTFVVSVAYMFNLCTTYFGNQRFETQKIILLLKMSESLKSNCYCFPSLKFTVTKRLRIVLLL